ncbi:hypothetical protein ANO14919_066770 [Xylariales sp. No.14919]|nr:hypothetical protein ANO14919_066770 [Xylariales sp. No.14919]
MLTKRSAPLYWLLSIAASSAVGNEAGGQRITPTPILQARGAFQTAGFISGNPDSPITCLGTSTVSKGPQYAFGCCDGTSCWKPASCETNGQPSCGPNCVYSQLTRCTDAASPSCAEYVLRTAADDENPFTSFLCLPAATRILVFVDPTAGNGAGSSAVGSSGGSRGTSISTGSLPADTSTSSPANGNGGDGGGGGLTLDQKIALGVGIGVGVAAIIVTILAWWWPRRSRW